jgi:hypothetical protein
MESGGAEGQGGEVRREAEGVRGRRGSRGADEQGSRGAEEQDEPRAANGERRSRGAGEQRCGGTGGLRGDSGDELGAGGVNNAAQPQVLRGVQRLQVEDLPIGVKPDAFQDLPGLSGAACCALPCRGQFLGQPLNGPQPKQCSSPDSLGAGHPSEEGDRFSVKTNGQQSFQVP